MAGQSIILGYIVEPDGADRIIESHNRAKIFALGRLDEFPPLNSTFFAPTGEAESYGAKLLYFAGSFKEVERDWEQWLGKFEGLLKTMVWQRVYLSLETPFFGRFEYRWEAAPEIAATFGAEVPRRVTDWFFTGGPRRFADYFAAD